MQSGVKHLIETFNSMRSGRVTDKLLDHIEIEHHGGKVLLKHVAQMSVLDSTALRIDLFDSCLAPKVKQAILERMQLQVSEMGTSLKLVVPAMTNDLRDQLVKQAHKYAEAERVVLRNIRTNALTELKAYKKEFNISEDTEKRWHNEIDKIHKQYDESIHMLLQYKEHQIQDKTFKSESEAKKMIDNFKKDQ